MYAVLLTLSIFLSPLSLNAWDTETQYDTKELSNGEWADNCSSSDGCDYYTQNNQPVSGVVFSKSEDDEPGFRVYVRNGLQNGKIQFFETDKSDVYKEGLMEASKEKGACIIKFKNGKIIGRDAGCENFSNPVKVNWFPEKDEIVVHRERSWKSGIWQTYDNKKPIKEETYVKGKKTGPYKEYYPSGQLAVEGTYLNDIKNGKWTRYYPNGKLQSEENYTYDPNRLCTRTYEKSGAVQVKCDEAALLLNTYTGYDDDKKEPYIESTDDLEPKKNGKWTYYYGNGQLWFIKNYQNDVPHGKLAYYYDTGKLRQEQHYENGNRIGKWKGNFPNGKIWYEFTYKKGKGLNPDYVRADSTEDRYEGFDKKTAPTIEQGKEYFSSGKLHRHAGFKKDGTVFHKWYKEDGNLYKEFWYYPKTNTVKVIDYDFKSERIYGTNTQEHKSYHSNGHIKNEHINNLTDSTSIDRNYNENGILISEKHCTYDKLLCSYKSYYDTGLIKTEGNYQNFDKTNLWKQYNEKGIIIEELDYNEDVLFGEARYYYDNGFLKARGNYVAGKKFQKWEYFDKYGRHTHNEWCDFDEEDDKSAAVCDKID